MLSIKMLEMHRQWVAAAWLNETGEHRPALEFLRGEKTLIPELRIALANWIAKGSKRRRGSVIPKEPLREYPPKLAASLRIAVTKKEHQAWWLFMTLPITHSFVLIAAKHNFNSKRGRPRTPASVAIAIVAKKVGISERTARAWFKRFAPSGYDSFAEAETRVSSDPN